MLVMRGNGWKVGMLERLEVFFGFIAKKCLKSKSDYRRTLTEEKRTEFVERGLHCREKAAKVNFFIRHKAPHKKKRDCPKTDRPKSCWL